MSDLKKYWQNRAIRKKDDISGVVFSDKYPKYVINQFHSWTIDQITDNTDDGESVLDVGCGYGRIARELIRHNELTIDGIDISKKYVELFNKEIGKSGRAYEGDVLTMKLPNNKYELILIITVLMYFISKKDQFSVLNRLTNLLRKNGKIVLIERTPLMKLLEFKKLFKNSFKDQTYLTTSEIEQMSSKLKLKCKKLDSWPFLFLPLYRSYLLERR